jgi:hypothetical protein
VYLKVLRDDLFQKIDKTQLSLQELSDLIGDLMLTEDKNNNIINAAYIEALILWFYNNNREYRKKIDLLGRDEEGKSSTPIKSKLGTKDDDLSSYFEKIERLRYDSLKLDFFLKKINLTEPITIQ